MVVTTTVVLSIWIVSIITHCTNVPATARLEEWSKGGSDDAAVPVATPLPTFVAGAGGFRTHLVALLGLQK